MAEINFKWGYSQSVILKSTLESFEKAQIRYFILRNYEGLPENNTSKDVDIIIEPRKFKLAKKIFVAVLKDNNISNYYQMDFERAHCCFGIDVEKDFAIHLDLIEGYSNKGYEFVSFEVLYQNTIEYKTFRVLNDSYDSCILLMYKLIGCKQLKDKYKEKIYTDFTSEKSTCSKTICKILGDKLGMELTCDIKTKNFYRIVSNANQIGSIAKRRVFFRNPVSTIGGIWGFYWEKFWNMVICPKSIQHLIVVEAPDGTGKTTFIDALRIKISEFFVADLEKTTVYHFRPTLLPNLGAVGEKAGVMKQDTNFTVPHRAKPANVLSSFVRMTYYWLDYVIGMPLVLRKSAQFDHITIFDRYIYDFLVDPERTRIKLPYWLRRIFTRLVKQPSIVFVLQAPADVIYNRKQELTKGEINYQLEGFRKLSSLGDSVHFLDATKKPDEMAKDAIKIILDTFTTKLSDYEVKGS